MTLLYTLVLTMSTKTFKENCANNTKNMGFDEKVDKEYEIPSRDIAQLQGTEIMQYYHTCLQKVTFK